MFTGYEKQADEIKTIKPRTLQLNLSDADVIRISEKAEIAGLTVAQLLESFIGDLVSGTYSNGSDEREYVQAWFERCGYGFYCFSSFTGFLLSEYLYDEYEELTDNEEDYRYEIDCGENDPEDVTEFKILLQEAQEQLARIYDQYAAAMQRRGEQPATKDQCKENFKQYKKALNSFEHGERG